MSNREFYWCGLITRMRGKQSASHGTRDESSSHEKQCMEPEPINFVKRRKSGKGR